VFSTGGGEEMARREGVPFLGSMPIDTELVTLLDAAESTDQSATTGQHDEASEVRSFGVLQQYQKTSSAKILSALVEKLILTLPSVEHTSVNSSG
jgi:hypothetical protein